jgi:transposase
VSAARPIARSRRDSAATRQLWADRFKRFRTAGLTVAAFCAAEGVSVPTFYQWKRQLTPKDPPAGTATVVPVRIATPDPIAPEVEVVLPSGIRVRFGPACELGVITAFVRQLGGAGC